MRRTQAGRYETEDNMRAALLFLLITTLAGPVSANSLVDKLKTGAGKVGDVAKKGVCSALEL